MAAFNLTAQLNIVGPNNLRPVIADIRRQISSINTNINFTVNPAAIGSSSQLARSLQDLNRAFASVSSSAGNATAAINNFSNSLQRVNLNRVNQNITQTNQSLQNLQRNQRQTSQSIGESTNAMQEFGRQSALAIRRFAAFSVVTGVIFKVTSAISSASSEFMTFNKELVRVAQVTGQSVDSLSTLERQITNLSTNLGVSSTELIKVSSTLAQAGLTAKEAEQALKALALSALAPSFDKLSDTVEGSIALMRQFSISTAQLEGALGSINAVAAKFAVEASDIITAIQRTGGVFANASKGVTEGTEALNQFIAVFTSIRATTRESAETIATGLRTIFTRIQRGKTIEALKEYGVVLTDLEGKFVGPYEAVRRLSEGLARLDPRDLRFSQIIEELGGFRQIGKVIPLIQQFTVAQQALGVAQRGSGSLAGDAAKAQQALAVQIAKVQEEFVGLVRKIGSSKEFQSMVSMALSLASALIKIAEASKHALPAITAMLAIKGTMGAVNFLGGFMGSLGGGRGRPPGRRAAYGGKIGRYADGGEIPVALMPGEAVFYPEEAKKIGTSKLRRMNYADKYIQKKAGGGKIGIVPGQGNSDSFYTTLPEGSFVIRKAATEALGLAKGGYTKKSTDKKNREQLKASQNTHFTHITSRLTPDNFSPKVRKYLLKNKISAIYSNMGLDLPGSWNSNWNLPKDNKGVFSNILSSYIKNYDIFKTLKSGSKKYRFTGRSQSVAQQILMNSADSIRKVFGQKVGRVSKFYDIDPEVSVVLPSLLKQSIKSVLSTRNEADSLISGLEESSVYKTGSKRKAITSSLRSKISKNLGGYIQNFAEGSDEPITFPGRSKFLKTLNAVKASSLIGGRDARKILGMQKRSGQDAADFKTLMAAYGEIVKAPKPPKSISSARTIGAIGLTGESGEQIVKSSQGQNIKIQKGVIDPGLSRRFRADVRKASRELAKKWGGIFAAKSGSSPVVSKKELDRILGPGLSNITGAVFESALAAAGAPYEATLRKRPIDFPQGLGKVGAIAGLPEDLATEAKADLSSAALKRVATQADPSPRKRKRRSKLKYGGFPLVDDLPNAPGSVTPMPGISPGSPLYKIIKNKGGVLDYDRTLQRTVGDAAYASAKTEEQRNAVLDRYFRDSSARLQDAKTAKLTQFGQQLQALIKKGIIDPKKLSIISKSSKTEGLPEHINRLFGIPTGNMEFTSGQSKVGLLQEIRKKGPKAYRRYTNGGSLYKNDKNKKAGYDSKKLAAFLGASPVATDKQNKLAKMLNEGQVKKPDYEELLKKLKGYAAGGEIPIMAQEGEFVINKHSARSIGYNNLKKLNSGGNINQLPKYHSGGKVQKLKRGGVTGKSFTDTQSPLDLLQKTPSGDYVARAVKHNQTRDKAIKDIADSRAKEAQELTAAAGDAKKQAAITKTAKTERANIRKAVAADKSRAQTDPEYLKGKKTAAEMRADMEARGKKVHRSLDDVTAREVASRTSSDMTSSLGMSGLSGERKQNVQAAAKKAGYSSGKGASAATSVTDADLQNFRKSQRQKRQESRTATSNIPNLDNSSSLYDKVAKDQAIERRDSIRNQRRSFNKQATRNNALVTGIKGMGVGAMAGAAIGGAVAGPAGAMLGAGVVGLAGGPIARTLSPDLARKRAIKHEAIAGKYQAKSVSLADKASSMAGGGGSTSGIMAGLNKVMSPLVSTMSKVNAGMAKVHGGIAVFNRGLAGGGNGLKSYAANIIKAQGGINKVTAAITPLVNGFLKIGKGADAAAGRLMGMQKGAGGKWSNAPGGIMGRVGGFFGMGGGGGPGPDGVSRDSSGRRRRGFGGGGRRGGGGEGFGYMGMMAMDMVGSMGVEALASSMGGEKTKEGRQVSTIGGSALAGASTGAMIGSVIPGVGTVVGGAIGAGAGALYGMAQSQQQEKEVLSQERRDKMETGISKMNQNLSIASDTSVSDATRQKARNEALSNFRTVSAENKKEQASGMERTRSWGGYFMDKAYGLVGGQESATASRKTVKERQEAAQPAADAAKQFLIAEMNRTGQTLAQLEKTMPAEDFKKLSESIALTDAGYQSLSEAIAADGKVTTEEVKVLERARRAAMERSGADLKVAEEAMTIAREQKKLQQAMQKLSTSFEKAAENMTSAVGVASTMLDRAAANIEAIDNPTALTSNASRSNNLDELNNLNAFSTSDQENILRKNAGMFGSSAESMVRSATLPRRLEEGLKAGMVGTEGKTGDEQKEAATKAISQTMESAFGPEMAGQMQGKIKGFIDKFVAEGGDLSQLDIGALMSEFPELANAAASSAKALEAIKAAAELTQKAMNLAASAASNMAEKRQQARNNTADTYQTVGQSTIDFKRAIGEKVSWRSEAGLRTGARAIRMGTDAATASDPKAIAARYKAQTEAAKKAALNQNQNQIQLNSGQAGAGGMSEKDMTATATNFTNAAAATAELANSAAQAREELMRMPDDIKSNIQGIMSELQDVLQERAAKVNAASGFMEKVLTSTPKELMQLGDTMNNVSRALSGNAVSFQESKAANMAYNKTIRAGGTHGQAQKAAQEAYAKETSDSLSMVKEIAPLIGAVNPEEQNKMMATMYESMFKARGMDPSKMQVGDKTMADYLKMMKEGAGKDPKVQALEQALAAEQAALQTATETINQVLKDEATAAIKAASDAIVNALKEAQTIFNERQAADQKNGITPPGQMPGAPTNPVTPPPNVAQQIAAAQAAPSNANTTSGFPTTPGQSQGAYGTTPAGQPIVTPTVASVSLQNYGSQTPTTAGTPVAVSSPVPAPRVTPPATPAQNNNAGVLPGVAGFDQFASKLDALLGKLANVSIPTEIRIKLDSSAISVQLSGQELLNNLQKILGESVRTEIASAISQYNSDNFQGEGKTPSSRPVGAPA